jgi:hypothetical protein
MIFKIKITKKTKQHGQKLKYREIGESEILKIIKLNTGKQTTKQTNLKHRQNQTKLKITQKYKKHESRKQ